MEGKLKSVLKIPKLGLAVKAGAMAIGLYFLPIWAASILAILFYFTPSAFSFNFLGTFVSFLIIVGALSFIISPAYGGLFIALLAGFLFFLLLGVKNVLFARRFPILYFLINAMAFIALWGFFSGMIPLLVLAPIVFLISRDALAALTSFPERTSLLAAVIALLATQLSWAVFYLGIPVWWASAATFLVFSGALYAIVNHLRGELFKSNAPFVAVACSIISFTLLILVSF